MRVLGVLGFSKTGKDTIADFLVEEAGYVRVAFADELKRFVMRLFEFSEDQMWGDSKEVPDERYPRDHTMVQEPGSEGKHCACCRSTDLSTQCYLTGRYALQIFGTEAGRHCYQSLWVSKALKIAHLLNMGGVRYGKVSGLTTDPNAPPRSVIISDLRFVSEVRSLRERGFEVYRVKRKGFEKPLHNHPSETEQLRIPDEELQGVLINDGTLEDLKKRVHEVILSKRGKE